MPHSPPPSIYEYFDYRAYLRDFLKVMRERGNYSLEAVARRSACMSKSHLSLIVQGKRKLTGPKLIPLAKALRLKKPEMEYLRNLVSLTQAETSEDKDHYAAALIRSLPAPRLTALSADAYTVLENWHAMVIRELARLPDFRADPALIARRLKNRLTPAAAARALELLRESRLLTPDEAGNLRPSAATLASTSGLSSIAIRRYHRSCLDLAKQTLDSDPVERREMASLNLVLSPEARAHLRRRFQEFRDELMALCSSEGGAGAQVCQLNMQYLELTD